MGDDALNCVHCDNPMRVSWRGFIYPCRCALAAGSRRAKTPKAVRSSKGDFIFWPFKHEDTPNDR